MNSTDDIEQALREVRLTIPPEIDRKILREGLDVFAGQAAVRLAMTRGVRRRRWPKASAAVVALVVFGSRPSITLADVKAAFVEQA